MTECRPNHQRKQRQWKLHCSYTDSRYSVTVSGILKGWEREQVKVSPSFAKHINMKTHGALEVQRHEFLTLILDRCKWPVYRWGHSHRKYGTERIQTNAAISEHDITFWKNKRYTLGLNCLAVNRPCYKNTKRGIFYNCISGLQF